MLLEHPIGHGVALVADHHAGGDSEKVVGVVPLLAFGGSGILVRGEHNDVVDAERVGNRREQVIARFDV